jgi:hypothetical protein
LKERVILSKEVGVMKPNEKIFRAAIDKISRDLSYQIVILLPKIRSIPLQPENLA